MDNEKRFKILNLSNKKKSGHKYLLWIILVIALINGSIILAGLTMRNWIANVGGGFVSIEKMVTFYEGISEDRIVAIVEGDSSALVCHLDEGNTPVYSFATKHNGGWINTWAFTQSEVCYNTIQVDHYYLPKTKEHYLSFWLPFQGQSEDYSFSDEYGTIFLRIDSNRRSHNYVAYLKPEKKEYVFWWGEKQCVIKLQYC